MANSQELYNQALEAIDSGDVNKGIDLLRQSLEKDSDNLDGWIKLAEVMPDNSIKYEVLEQVLQLDPANDFANREWDRLNLLAEAGRLDEPSAGARGAEKAVNDFFVGSVDSLPPPVKAQSESKSGGSLGPIPLDSEWIAGISNRELVFVGGGLLIFTLVMCFITYTVIFSANRNAAQRNAEATALVVGITQTLDADATNRAATFAAATQILVDMTATVEALVSSTPVPEGGLSRATAIPPSLVPEPTLEVVRVFSVPPSTLPGNLLAWGGSNPATSRYLSLYRVSPTTAEAVKLNDEFVTAPTIDVSGNHLVYMRYNSSSNDALMDWVSVENPTDFPETLNFVFPGLTDPTQPSVSVNGNFLAFVGVANGTNWQQVYLWNFDSEELTRLSNDDENYLSAAVAPDGDRIVAVREVSGGTDLVLFEVDRILIGEPPVQTQLTNDGDAIMETNVEFSSDGTKILYSAKIDESGDIVLMDLQTLEITSLIATEADEILPHYSPDNRFILYSGNHIGPYNLFVFDTIAGQTYQVTERVREPMFAAGWYN